MVPNQQLTFLYGGAGEYTSAFALFSVVTGGVDGRKGDFSS